jgi:hypothetical protein
VISVSEAVSRLQGRGALQRRREDYADRILSRVESLLGRPAPEDLADFYRARITSVAAYEAIMPVWNDWVGWRTPIEAELGRLLDVQALPVFRDRRGALFGIDLSVETDRPDVYFFQRVQGVWTARWAAGSSLGAFMLLLSDYDRAYQQNWPAGWEQTIDPSIINCHRAPPAWLAHPAAAGA